MPDPTQSTFKGALQRTSNENIRYIHAVLCGCILFSLGLSYSLIRDSFDIVRSISAVSAFVSLCMLGLVLLLGPLTRLYQLFARFIIYRKHIGIVAAIFGLLHGVVTLVMLQGHFPLYSYVENIPAVFTALVSFFLLLLLLVISHRFVSSGMNKRLWWWMQQWGLRMAVVAAFLHTIMRSIPVWKAWSLGESVVAVERLPPLGLLLSIFLGFVMTVRLSEFAGVSISKTLVLIWFIIYVALSVACVVWAIR